VDVIKGFVLADPSVVTAETDPVTGGISLASSGYTIPLDKPRQSIWGLPKVMAFGNSIPKQNQIGANAVANNVTYNAHLWWALAFAGQPFQWTQTGGSQQIGGSASSLLCQGIYGYSGATSSDVLPFFAQVVTANAPQYCFMQIMENDVTAIVSGSITRTQAKANYLSMIQQALAGGTIPIWIGCLPSKLYTLTTHAAEYWALTDYVESLQYVYPGMIYVPVHDLYIDSTQTTPLPLTAGIYANYVDASVHPQAVAPLLGQRIADVLLARGLNGFGLVPGPGDARYVGGNSFTSGTAGTASAPVTGQVVNNLNISSSTTTQTVAVSVVDRKNKQAQKIDMTAGTATGVQAAWTMYGNAGGFTTGFSVGDLVQSFVEIEFDAAVNLVGLRDLTSYLNFVGGSNDAYMFKKASGDVFDTITIPTGRKMLIATPITAVPASTTGLRPFFQCFASSGSASIINRAYITKFAVVNWSNRN